MYEERERTPRNDDTACVVPFARLFSTRFLLEHRLRCVLGQVDCPTQGDAGPPGDGGLAGDAGENPKSKYAMSFVDRVAIIASPSASLAKRREGNQNFGWADVCLDGGGCNHARFISAVQILFCITKSEAGAEVERVS